MSPGRGIGLGVGAAALVAVGAAVGAAAEDRVVRRGVRRLQAPDLTPLVGQSMTVIADDGTPLHAEIDPPPPGREHVTVVLTHGYSLSMQSWHFQRRALREHARVVVWDQRGHGRSGRGSLNGRGLAQLGSDLAHVIDAAAPEGTVVLVGHSMGGMTIMAYAAEHPEAFGPRVRAAALVATAASGIADVTLGLPQPLARAAHRLGPRALAALARNPALVELGRRSGSDLGLLITAAYSFGSDVHPDTTRFVSDMLTATPIDVIADFLPALQVHDRIDALAAMREIEVLVMVGTADKLTPSPRSEEIVRYLPGAELVVIDNAGHMLMLESHEAVDARLVALVDRVAATP